MQQNVVAAPASIVTLPVGPASSGSQAPVHVPWVGKNMYDLLLMPKIWHVLLEVMVVSTVPVHPVFG